MDNETYYVKINGKSNIPSRLAIGHNYKLHADCSITSETKTDNDDGSFDVTFRIEPITVEIIKDNGETVKAKDPRKNSVKFRNSCWRVSDANQIEQEEFYNYTTIQAIKHLDTWAEEYKNEKQ